MFSTCSQLLLTVSSFDQVITHPFFDGKEEAVRDRGLRLGFKVYLRAQIARITADTMICPKGYLFKARTCGMLLYLSSGGRGFTYHRES